MSHHSDESSFGNMGGAAARKQQTDAIMAKLQAEMEQHAHPLGLGATGQFPDGKLADHDEGEIKIGIAADVENQRVLIDFGKSIRSLGLTGEQAESIADMLHEKALELRGIKSQ